MNLLCDYPTLCLAFYHVRGKLPHNSLWITPTQTHGRSCRIDKDTMTPCLTCWNKFGVERLAVTKIKDIRSTDSGDDYPTGVIWYFASAERDVDLFRLNLDLIRYLAGHSAPSSSHAVFYDEVISFPLPLNLDAFSKQENWQPRSI